MDSDKHDNVVLPRMLTTLLDQHHDAYFIKGVDSSFIYANAPAARKLGLNSPSELLYKNENNLSSHLTENKDIVKEWQWQDKQVTEFKKHIDTLEINPGAITSPYIVKKFPFYNEINQCKGIVIYCKNIEGFAFKDLFGSHLSGSFLLTKPDDFFDEKESEVIFLKLQGQMPKSIARRLVSSTVDVENILQELYCKAGVKHFDDFSEFCYKRNYHRYLPRRFIES